ncbi:MAG TPA: transglycosylase SLT domain-containing protein [Burkholderiales bacterium]|nr:transglycosylase SLT domain-containing protein [Burkholderiales bacterium]
MEEPLLTHAIRTAAAVALALLQACASQPEAEAEADTLPAAVLVMPAAVPVPAAEPPAPAVQSAQPARSAPAVAKARPAPAPAPAFPPVPPPLDATHLPPFDGERLVVQEPLRGVPKIDRTAPVEDLWQRIRQGFAIPNLDNKLVKQHTAYYAREKDYLQRIFDRSRLYLFYIVEEIEKRGLPTELALLPMVESAFNPMAYSRAHASGIWQFIPGTGRRYDLKQDWWYDGRRDIVASTNAALDYLTTLYEMHGDWQLALASYNWGENAVKRAIVRNRKERKPTDYSSLRMPRETRHYIPKLQALKNIISNPEPFGINLDPIPNEPYFAVVTETPDIDVITAAKLADMPVEDFIALNPGFSRPLIRSSAATRIVLPADKVEVFHDNLAKHDDDKLVSWEVYHPTHGERLGTIAKKFDLGVDELKRVNGIHPRSWHVPKLMVVPINGSTREAKLPIMYAPPIPAVRAVHVVRRGDTLSGIAQRYRVRVSDLKAWNRVGRYLQVGQRITIRAR